MPQYMVHYNPKPEDCPCAIETDDPHLKGRAFFCTCDSGTHGSFVQLEAASPDEALSWFPEAMRKDIKVYTGETMTVP